MYGWIEAAQVPTATAIVPPSSSATSSMPVASAPLTPMQLMQRALEAGNLELVERMMTLQERWEATQARKAFEAAMAEVRSELPIILKNCVVDYTSPKGRTSYVHEDLAGIARQIDPILSKYSLSYRFRTKTEGTTLTVTCIISHRGGYSEENSLSAPFDASGNKNPIQAIGSAQTYLQRYSLKAALGLAAGKDTDAQTSTQSQEETGELISADQIQTITAALKVRELDEDEWLKRASAALKINMETLSDIPVASFQRCLDNVRKAGDPQ